MLSVPKKAFTLIEVLVVITIIGILAVMVIFLVGNARNTTRNAAVKSNVVEAGKSIEVFRNEDSASDSIISNLPLVNSQNLPARDSGHCGQNRCDSLSCNGINNTGVNNLPSIFTGKISTGALTYPAKLNVTPSCNNYYTYTAFTNPSSTTRALVGLTAPNPLYNFCGYLYQSGTALTNQFFCSNEAGTTLTPYDPQGQQRFVQPHSEKLPNTLNDGTAVSDGNQHIFIIGIAVQAGNSQTLNSVTLYDVASKTTCLIGMLAPGTYQPTNYPVSGYSSIHDTVYVFGGYSGNVYSFSASTYSTCPTGPIPVLQPIVGLTYTTGINTVNSGFAVNPLTDDMYVVGGNGGSGGSLIDVFNMSTNTFRYGVNSASPLPAPLGHMGVAYNTNSNKLFILGGGGNSGSVNTITQYDASNYPTTHSLTPIPTSAVLKEPVSVLSVAWDQDNQNAYTVGGWRGDACNDITKPTCGSPNIEKINLAGNPVATFATDQQVTYLTGGQYGGIASNSVVWNKNTTDNSKSSAFSFGNNSGIASDQRTLILEYFPNQ